MPFEVVGAPWVDGRELADYLNRRGVPGVRFAPTSFTPSSSRYAGRQCGGIRMAVGDRNVLDLPRLGLELAAALRHLYPKEYELDSIGDLLSDAALLDGLRAGKDPRESATRTQRELREFLRIRQKYLLY